MNVRQQVEKLEEVAGSDRFGKDRAESWKWARQPLLASNGVGDMPVTIDGVPSPHVDPEWYGANYYWNTRDRNEAREVQDVEAVGVRAVNIDAMGTEDVERQRTPSGWHPRVELTLEAQGHRVVGDLTPDQAIEVAMQLLQAARLQSRW